MWKISTDLIKNESTSEGGKKITVKPSKSGMVAGATIGVKVGGKVARAQGAVIGGVAGGVLDPED